MNWIPENQMDIFEALDALPVENYQLAKAAWNNWEWSREYPVRSVSYIKDSVKMDFLQAVRIVRQLQNECV